MAGIVVGWVCDIAMLHTLSVLVFSAIMLAVGMMRFAPKWLFGAGVMLLMFSSGLFVENRQSVEKTALWSNKKGNYTAHLVEVPALRCTNVKVLAELSADSSEESGSERRHGLVYLYFSRTVESEQLSIGDMIALESAVSPPKNQGNPAEFDIESFYYIKGITGETFVPEGKWRLLPHGKKNLRIRALELRAKAVEVYEHLGFEQEPLVLLSSLTLGEKRDFPKELKENFTVAGANHILALSGLHLGILYLILTMLLPQRGRRLVFRLLRELVVLALLWAFAFIAGLSPSIVRSATLFTLMSIGRLLGNDVSPLSSLSFAATVMLLVSPHLLFDVSFQLSFAAVFSILLLAPPLQELMGVYRYGKVYGYIANLLILSVVSQVGTLPFVWYYFGVFPVYFLLTNLLVVPLAFVVILLAVIMWMLLPIPFLQQGVAWLLGIVVSLMGFVVDAVASLPGASLSLPPLGVFGAVSLALLVVLLLIALFQRRWWLVVLVSCNALLLMIIYIISLKPVDNGNYMIIYNNRKNPLVHLVYDGGRNYLVSTVPQLDAEYEYVSGPFLRRESLGVPDWVYWEYNDSLVSCNEGAFSFDGVSVKLLDNAHWRDNERVEPVDILVLCRGFLGRISELVEVYPAACVVLDGSLYKHSRERIKREYARLGVEVVDISESGAMKVVPDTESFDLIPMRGK